LLLLSLLLAALNVRAQDPKPPEAPSTFDLQAIDAYVAGQVRAKSYPGLALTIVRDGKIVLAKGYGRCSLVSEERVGPDTLFAIGSVTKQFTCACILLLAEDGKLSVEDRVAKYYPDLTRANDISLYDLMTHTSGYPDYYPLDFVDRRIRKPIALDQLLAEYAGGKLDFEPGTRWSYSNTGYILLGRVIEKVSKEPMRQFLDRRILKPLGMKHSVFEPNSEGARLAHGHTSFALGPAEPASREADGWLHAAGGLWSSVSDLARWDLALMEGKVLKPESYRLLTTRRKLQSGKTKDYGCGMGCDRPRRRNYPDALRRCQWLFGLQRSGAAHEVRRDSPDQQRASRPGVAAPDHPDTVTQEPDGQGSSGDPEGAWAIGEGSGSGFLSPDAGGQGGPQQARRGIQYLPQR
jgi:CubicO group peptidase (beta-lactamase class C family)